MSTRKRILRAIGVCVLGIVAMLAGFYIKQVLIGGGQYAPDIPEVVIGGVVGAAVGFLAPDADQRKKNRENLFNK